MLTQLKLYLILGIIVAVLGSGLGLYMKGRSDMRSKIQAETAASFQKEVKRYEAIEKQTHRMGKSDLDRALSYWLLRDATD